MKRPATQRLFLARDSYRRRRLADAARILPWLGVFVFSVPTFWAPAARTSAGTIYVFALWFLLIVLSFLVSRRLRRRRARGPEAG